MAESKLKKIAKATKLPEVTPTNTKMGPDGEFLIKEQEFRTKGGQTLEPNKGLADKVREGIKESNRIKDIKNTRPYYDGEIVKGKGVTIEPNKNVGKLAIDAKRPDMPDIKPITDRDFELKKGAGRTIEPNKEFPRPKSKPTMPNVSDKQVRKMAAARKVHGTAPVETEFGALKKIKAPSTAFGKKIADKVIKAHETHLGNLAVRAASSKAKFVEKAVSYGSPRIVAKAAGAVKGVGTGVRRLVGSAGGKMAKGILSKTIGRAAGPIGVVGDLYEIGTAVNEGYKAYKAGQEYKTLYEKMKNKKYKPAISPDGKPSGM